MIFLHIEFNKINIRQMFWAQYNHLIGCVLVLTPKFIDWKYLKYVCPHVPYVCLLLLFRFKPALNQESYTKLISDHPIAFFLKQHTQDYIIHVYYLF